MPPPDPKRLAFLAARFEEVAVRQPGFRRLREILLGIGGVALVVPRRGDPDLDGIFAFGRLFDASTAELVPGEPSSCHTNVSRMWRARGGAMGIATGYGLSEDGLWRSHTWGYQERAVETTLLDFPSKADPTGLS